MEDLRKAAGLTQRLCRGPPNPLGSALPPSLGQPCLYPGFATFDSLVYRCLCLLLHPTQESLRSHCTLGCSCLTLYNLHCKKKKDILNQSIVNMHNNTRPSHSMIHVEWGCSIRADTPWLYGLSYIYFQKKSTTKVMIILPCLYSLLYELPMKIAVPLNVLSANKFRNILHLIIAALLPV